MKRLRKVANNEYGPDDVRLKKPVDGYPAGTICTIMDITYNNKFVVQVNDDGHEITTTKGNIARLDGQPIEW